MLDLGGLRLHWREDGDPTGAPVMFANSLGTDMRLWDAVVPHLPGGLRLVRYDMRGHGLSDCPPAPYAMDDLVRDAEGLIEALGLHGVVFVGLSIGGMVAQGLAACRPDLLAGVVLSNTAAKIGTPEVWRERIDAVRAGGIEALADGVLERWFGPEFRATEEAAAWRHMLTRQPPEGYAGCAAAIADADFTAAMRGLQRPTLAIAGSVDGSTPPDLVRATAELVPGAAFHVIEGAGHLPCVDRPAEYAARLTAFLQEIGHV
jgi:3-oxoadipate enol-lactonase